MVEAVRDKKFANWICCDTFCGVSLHYHFPYSQFTPFHNQAPNTESCPDQIVACAQNSMNSPTALSYNVLAESQRNEVKRWGDGIHTMGPLLIQVFGGSGCHASGYFPISSHSYQVYHCQTRVADIETVRPRVRVKRVIHQSKVFTWSKIKNSIARSGE